MNILQVMTGLGLVAFLVAPALGEDTERCRKQCDDSRQACRKEALAYGGFLHGRSGDRLRHPEDRYDERADTALQRKELMERCESVNQACQAECRPVAVKAFPTGEYR